MHPRLGKKVARGAALLAALVVVGCGKTGATMTDGWDASPDALSARRAFDLVAALRSDGGSTALPPTNAFTLVTDPATRSAIVGGGGRGAVVPLSTSDGKITDRASGVAGISCGDCLYVVPFEATVSGTLDATAPTLIPSETPRTPFDSVRVVASEPLPATASARLIADDGAAIDLVPVVIDGAIPIVVGFSKPDVVLRAGHGYDSRRSPGRRASTSEPPRSSRWPDRCGSSCRDLQAPRRSGSRTGWSVRTPNRPSTER